MLTDAERDATGAVVTPAVSVVVPCYNGGRYIPQMLESLAGQSFRDFETVIVDDGSTDAETIKKLASLGGAARVIRQDNRGPSAARNTGIRAARGDILFMLDCDDTIEQTFLEETVAALRAAPAGVGMVFTDQRLVGAETGLLPRYYHRFDLLFTNTMASGLVFTKASWLAVGGYDETMRDGYEDWDFSLRLASAGYRGLRVPKPLYVYHIRADVAADSRSSNVHAKQMYGRLWKLIRDRHAALYSLPAILRLWWAAEGGRGRVPLHKGLAAYGLAVVLPEALFSRLMGIRRRPRAQGHTPDGYYPGECYNGVALPQE